MAGKTEIGNKVLTKLGQSRVSNFDTDPTASAKAINEVWDSVLLSTLQSFPWNFATVRTNLAADTNAPSWGFNYKYPLPSDFLKLLQIKDEPTYQLEGGYILTDAVAPIYIKYVSIVRDSGILPPFFVELLSHNLAIETCERITGDLNLKQLLLAERKAIEYSAQTSDAVDNQPIETDMDDWIKVRF